MDFTIRSSEKQCNISCSRSGHRWCTDLCGEMEETAWSSTVVRCTELTLVYLHTMGGRTYTVSMVAHVCGRSLAQTRILAPRQTTRRSSVATTKKATFICKRTRYSEDTGDNLRLFTYVVGTVETFPLRYPSLNCWPTFLLDFERRVEIFVRQTSRCLVHLLLIPKLNNQQEGDQHPTRGSMVAATL